MDSAHTARTATNFSRKNFFAFLAVGALCTGTHYALMALLHAGFGLPAVLSSSFGFLFSAVLNYLLNRRYTFGSTQAHSSSAPRFVMTAACGLALNVAILSVAMAIDVGIFLAQLFSTIGVIAWNYCIHAAWTFRTARAPGPAR